MQNEAIVKSLSILCKSPLNKAAKKFKKPHPELHVTFKTPN